MVFFTCNHCGESLKKAAVEKHYQFKACRNGPIFVTCVDCLKDFREQEYVAHTKCITEAERYAAKGSYVAKPDKNKGAQKQEIWTECIQELSARPNIDRTLRNILEKIAGQSNVPRKKPKFINFLKSSMKYNLNQAEKVWTIIEDGLEEFKKRSSASSIQTSATSAAVSSTKSDEGEVSSTTEPKNTDQNGSNKTKPKSKDNDNVSTTNETLPDSVRWNAILNHALAQADLSKSVKKVLKKLKKQTISVDIPSDAKPPKRKKFIKLLQQKLELDAENSLAAWQRISLSITAMAHTNGTGSADEPATPPVNGSKKRKNNDIEGDNEAEPKKPKIETGKTDAGNGDETFDWQNNIVRIFHKNQSDNQMSINSLRLKVIKKILKASGRDCGASSGEEYFKKFKKQLKKIDSLVIIDDSVQLKV